MVFRLWHVLLGAYRALSSPRSLLFWTSLCPTMLTIANLPFAASASDMEPKHPSDRQRDYTRSGPWWFPVALAEVSPSVNRMRI